MAAPGALVVSLDFELHWGVGDRVPLGAYREKLLGVRAAVPAILDLFRAFDVHATWAVVGMLLCTTRAELLAMLPARRPSYVRRELSPYGAFPEVGEDERTDPFHFAPSLAERILETPHQEIGTHTFSHYYCVEDGQTEAEFRADLEAASAVTYRRFGLTPRSLVFPRNQVNAAYLAACGERGVIAYRGASERWAHRVRRSGDESRLRRAVRLLDRYLAVVAVPGPRLERGAASVPVDVPASRYLAPYRPALGRLERRRVARIVAEMRRAADEGRVYHLWWHPEDFGVHLGENLAVLRRILAEFATLRRRNGMTSLTMAEAASAMASGLGLVAEESAADVREATRRC